MDRRAPALAALLLFAVATVAATALDGRLPASEDSVAGWVLQVLGHLAAIAGGVLLLTTDGHPGRRSGAVVLGAVLVLVLADALALALADDAGGANIGLGGVRLLGLVAVGAVALRLAPAVARDRRSPPARG
ncbi:hypothetical protein [Blastococcus sp. SYSU D01042]